MIARLWLAQHRLVGHGRHGTRHDLGSPGLDPHHRLRVPTALVGRHGSDETTRSLTWARWHRAHCHWHCSPGCSLHPRLRDIPDPPRIGPALTTAAVFIGALAITLAFPPRATTRCCCSSCSTPRPADGCSTLLQGWGHPDTARRLRGGISPTGPVGSARLDHHAWHHGLRRHRLGQPGRPDRRRRRPPADRTRPGRRRQPHRHRRRLLGRAVRGDPRPGPGQRPRRRADRHQGADADGRRTERRRPVPAPHHPRRRRPACAGWAPTTSTCTRCTSGTGRPRWRRRLPRWTHLVRSGKVRYIGALQLRRLAADEGAWHVRAARLRPASSASRSTTRCRPATPRTNWSRWPSTKAWASWSGARSPAACCPASTGAGRTRPPAAGTSPTGTSRRSTTRTSSTTPSRSLVDIAEAHGVSAAQVALAYTIGKPGVTSVIVGARTEEQLTDNLAAADLALTDDERRAAGRRQRAAAALPVLAPGQDRPATGSARPTSACWGATFPDRMAPR